MNWITKYVEELKKNIELTKKIEKMRCCGNCESFQQCYGKLNYCNRNKCNYWKGRI